MDGENYMLKIKHLRRKSQRLRRSSKKQRQSLLPGKGRVEAKEKFE